MTPATDGPRQVANRLNPLNSPRIVTAPEPDATTPRSRLTARSAIFALVVFGIALRIVPLVSDRCLWLDEAMLALNLVNRSPRQLLEPLDWNQGAPVGFLLAVKGTISAFGASEWALRLVPFLASCAGLFGFAWVARRLLPTYSALIAMGLLALSPYLISYAAECKQYASDAAIAIGLFACATGLLEGKGGALRWIALALT